MTGPSQAAGPAPRGWARLVALGPLTGRWRGQECTVVPGCGREAIVGTPDGWRCAEHPPLPGPPGVAGWGHALDWTPRGGNPQDRDVLTMQAAIRHEPVPPFRYCAQGPGRCYCGRCENYSVRTITGAGQGATDLRGQRKVYGRDVAEGRRRKDEGQQRARQAAAPWSAKAAAALARLARERATFTADDLVAAAGRPDPTQELNANNAIGAAFSAAARRGVIERVPGAEAYSTRPESHGRRLAVWRGPQ